MDNSNSPLVSVLMTAYNREEYIADAINSLLASTYINWELIIVDDCSSDNTVEIAKKFEQKDKRIRVFVNEQNLGDYPNRNRAASYAKGKYLKYLDSDDIIYSYGLEVMVSAMEQFPEAAIGIIFYSYDNINKLPFIFSPEEAFSYHFFKNNVFGVGPSACIYRNNVFNEIGGFGNYRVASDYEFNLRVAMEKSVVLLPRDLIWWRRHEEQDYKLYNQDYFRLNYEIHQSILNNRKSPLTEKEKKEIYCNINKHYARKVILSLIKFKYIYVINFYKSVKLPFMSYFYAMLPNKLRGGIVNFFNPE